MTWERLVFLIGEVHRPLSLLFFAAATSIGIFIPWVTEGKLLAAGGIIAIFVGARSIENSNKIKADAMVKTKETEMTGKPAVQTIADATNPPPPVGAPQ